MADIRKKYAVAETGVLHLLDASGKPMYADGADGKPDPTRPCEVVLYSPGSKQYAAAQAARQARVMDRMRRKGKAELSADERSREQAGHLASLTESMRNIDYEDAQGKTLQGDALHKAVYADVCIGFIADQVGEYLGDWANFSKASETT